MNEIKLKALFDSVEGQPPSQAAEDRAIKAGLAAFRAAGQKTAHRPRPIADAMHGAWRAIGEWTMRHRLMMGTAAACLVAVPIGITMYAGSFEQPMPEVGGIAGILNMEGGTSRPRSAGSQTEETVIADRGSQEVRSREFAAVPVAPAETGSGTQKPLTVPGTDEAQPELSDRLEAEIERVGQSISESGRTAQSNLAQAIVEVAREAERLQEQRKTLDARDEESRNRVVAKALEKLRTRPAEPVGQRRQTAGLVAGQVASEPQQLLAAAPPIAEPSPAPAPAAQPADPRFTPVDSNDVKLVADEPVSTFSIDVDTASYAHVRRMLKQGVLPEPASVRVEEMINYFSYDYPLPQTGEAPFRPNVAVYPTPWNENTKLVHIGIKGMDIVAAERPRANLVFLIDTSGSMNGPDRLPLLKTGFRLLLDQLDDDDTVSIVTYAGQAGTVLEPTKVSERARIIEAITNLTPGGSTAGAAGIRQAYALAERSFDRNGVNRVMLATDGDFNVGMTNINQLKGFIAKKRQSGVFLSVLGFGQGNYNNGLMQVLAQNGNGTAAYIDSLKEAEKVLVNEATRNLFPIAKDVKIQIEFNPETVQAYRLVGYETRLLRRQDFNDDRIDAGEIGSGHTVTALYEITPADSAAKLVDNLRYQEQRVEPPVIRHGDEYGFLRLRYKAPSEDTSKLIEVPVKQELERAAVAELSDDMRFAAAVAAFGQKLRGESRVSDISYAEIHDLATSARGADPFGLRAEFVEMVRLARLLDPMPATTSQSDN